MFYVGKVIVLKGGVVDVVCFVSCFSYLISYLPLKPSRKKKRTRRRRDEYSSDVQQSDSESGGSDFHLAPKLRNNTDTKPPTSRTLTELNKLGLVHINKKSPGLGIGRDWTFRKVDRLFAKILPRPFEHWSKLDPIPNPDWMEGDPSEQQFLPPYIICAKDGRKLTCCSVAFPTGEDVTLATKTVTRGSFEDNSIVLGKCH